MIYLLGGVIGFLSGLFIWKMIDNRLRVDLVEILYYPTRSQGQWVEGQLLKFKHANGDIDLVGMALGFYYYKDGRKANRFETRRIEDAIRRFNFPIYLAAAQEYMAHKVELIAQSKTDATAKTSKEPEYH